MSSRKLPPLAEIMGEAKKLVVIVFPLLAAAVAARIFLPGTFRFLGKFHGLGLAAGIELLAVGFIFWGSAASKLISALKNGTLATKGAYGLCRHPIFSWWIFFILPGLALVLNSWLFAILAVVVFVVAGNAAKTEESDMAKRFGEAYTEYSARTNRLFPLPRLRPVTFARYLKGLLSLAGLAIFALGILLLVVQPIVNSMGTTASERSIVYAADSILPKARQGFIQATTIKAPVEKVWPWLVQIGYKRAGWYNVDAINRLAGENYFYENNASATRLIPELQTLAIGDTISLAPGADLKVFALEENRLLSMAGDPAGSSETNAVWTFQLIPLGANSCRLVSKFGATFPGGLGAEILNGFINLIGGSIIQQPAMMYGIRARAERSAQ